MKFLRRKKINSVLKPGINVDHIEEITKTVKAAGATLYNIIPLISQYQLSLIPAPTCEQVGKARTLAREIFLKYKINA